MKDVLLRLQVLSLPGTPERNMLVNELLPAAFMADLSAALVGARSHRPGRRKPMWSSSWMASWPCSATPAPPLRCSCRG